MYCRRTSTFAFRKQNDSARDCRTASQCIRNTMENGKCMCMYVMCISYDSRMDIFRRRFACVCVENMQVIGTILLWRIFYMLFFVPSLPEWLSRDVHEWSRVRAIRQGQRHVDAVTKWKQHSIFTSEYAVRRRTRSLDSMKPDDGESEYVRNGRATRHSSLASKGSISPPKGRLKRPRPFQSLFVCCCFHSAWWLVISRKVAIFLGSMRDVKRFELSIKYIELVKSLALLRQAQPEIAIAKVEGLAIFNICLV